MRPVPPTSVLSPRWAVALCAAVLVTCSSCREGVIEEQLEQNDPLRPVVVQFPQGDPDVPAEQGGPGFVGSPGEAWQTDEDFPLEGSPQAVRGGAIRFWVGGFPNTLRTVGKDSRRLTNSLLRDLCYESLLERHSDTLEYIPRLASHWQVSQDKKTFRFRLNPRAHWWDGKPVVAEDVVATWQLRMDVKILEPAQQVIYGNFLRPRAVSKYIVEVQVKEANWRNLFYLSSMVIFPAHELQGLDGAEFLRRYQFRLLTGSGPYRVLDRDVKQGRSITLRRRDDYWGWRERFCIGRYNFDRIRLVTTEDYTLGLEKLKKGEIDLFRIGRAKDWAADLPRLDQVQRGLLIMRRVYNDEPLGVSGLVFNMRQPPLDDIRVRQALCHLFHRRKLIDKLFYGEYVPIDSYFPGVIDPPADREPIRYDPEAAQRLLAEAGWKERDAYGVLTRNGQPLEIELAYSGKGVERYLSVFQEDCRRAGVVIHLKQLTRATRFQITYGDRRFEMSTQGWGGRIDPVPDTNWLSALAGQPNNNNLAGFKDPEVDRLCKQYNDTYDRAARLELLKQIEARVYRQYPCVPGWSMNNIRLIYWNKFGQPPWYLGRTDGAESVLTTWWIDPQLSDELEAAKEDGSVVMDAGVKGIRYWDERAEATEK